MQQFLKLKNLKTLLIDDNVIIRDTMQMLFAQKRCLLKTCETAEDGLQALEAEHFDIIICDYQLPGIDGVKFFKRAVVSHPDTIKILISGFVNEGAISEAFDIGVHAFIRKPFSLMAFFEQLIPLVEKHQNRDPQNRDTSETEAATGNQYQTKVTGKKNQWCLAF
jgi:DNA-binding NtrC family response regulator